MRSSFTTAPCPSAKVDWTLFKKFNQSKKWLIVPLVWLLIRDQENSKNDFCVPIAYEFGWGGGIGKMWGWAIAVGGGEVVLLGSGVRIKKPTL